MTRTADAAKTFKPGEDLAVFGTRVRPLHVDHGGFMKLKTKQVETEPGLDYYPYYAYQTGRGRGSP